MANPKKQDKNFDEVPMTQEQYQEHMRKYMQRWNMNEVRLAGTVRSTFISEPKMKVDRKTNEPILGEDGQPTYWDSFRSVTVAFDGGEVSINLSKDIFETMVVGQRYLFEGVKGMSFGRVDDIYHSVTML